jgi:hypothetical protein
MKIDFLEHRINHLLGEAHALEASVYSYQSNFAQWTPDPNGCEIPDWVAEGEDEFIKPFEFILRSLHESIICYLDQKGLSNYLQTCLKRLGESITETDVRTFELDLRWSGQGYNLWLKNADRLMAAFEFANIDNDRYAHIVGVRYIETILKNTATIVLQSKKIPKKETDVTNIVRPIVNAVFPTSKNASSNFLKTAKEYKPDILIPELHVAIEYKYAQDETKLKACIDSIYADFQGYTGDSDYRIFYAVFYLTKDVWGYQKFSETWRETGFPQNWKAFYVIGP